MRRDAIRWQNYKIKKQMDSYMNIQYLFDGILCGQRARVQAALIAYS
jgi:hypothetical protein